MSMRSTQINNIINSMNNNLTVRQEWTELEQQKVTRKRVSNAPYGQT